MYGIADEATAANQVAQDPEASADVFMYANDTLTIMTDANALTKFGGRYREENRNNQFSGGSGISGKGWRSLRRSVYHKYLVHVL